MQFEVDRLTDGASWGRMKQLGYGNALEPIDRPVREVRDLSELVELVRQHGELRIEAAAQGRVPSVPRLQLGPR